MNIVGQNILDKTVRQLAPSPKRHRLVGIADSYARQCQPPLRDAQLQEFQVFRANLSRDIQSTMRSVPAEIRHREIMDPAEPEDSQLRKQIDRGADALMKFLGMAYSYRANEHEKAIRSAYEEALHARPTGPAAAAPLLAAVQPFLSDKSLADAFETEMDSQLQPKVRALQGDMLERQLEMADGPSTVPTRAALIWTRLDELAQAPAGGVTPEREIALWASVHHQLSKMSPADAHQVRSDVHAVMAGSRLAPGAPDTLPDPRAMPAARSLIDRARLDEYGQRLAADFNA